MKLKETSGCIPHPLFPNGSIYSIECYLAVCLLIRNYIMCQVNLIAGEYLIFFSSVGPVAETLAGNNVIL